MDLLWWMHVVLVCVLTATGLADRSINGHVAPEGHAPPDQMDRLHGECVGQGHRCRNRSQFLKL